MKITKSYEVYAQISDSLFNSVTKVFTNKAEAENFFQNCNGYHFVELNEVFTIKHFFRKPKIEKVTIKVKH